MKKLFKVNQSGVMLGKAMLCIGAGLFSTSAAAQVIYHDDPFPYSINGEDTTMEYFSKGSVSHRAQQGNNKYRGFIGGNAIKPLKVGNHSRRGSHSFKFETPPQNTSNSQRTEIDLLDRYINLPRGDHLSPGDVRYMGFSFRFDNDNFPPPNSWMDIAQIKMGGGWPNIEVKVNFAGNMLFRARGGESYKNQKAVVNNQFVTKYKKGVWYDAYIGFKYSPLDSSGWVEFNLKEATDVEYKVFSRRWNNVQIGYSSEPDRITAARVGIYKGGTPQNHKMWIDEVRYSDTLADITQEQKIPMGWQQLEFRHSGKCFDGKGSPGQGTQYHQWDCIDNHINQQVRFESLGDDLWSVRSRKSNRCLDVRAGNLDDGGILHQWSCRSDNPNQAWKVIDQGDGWFSLKSKRSSRCVDVAGVSNATAARIQQWWCWNGENQQMRFR